MRPDRRFYQPAPELPVLSRLIEGKPRLRADERRVQYLKFGARCPLADLMGGKLLQAGQQFQVMGQVCRIAHVLELTDHLLVGKNLSGEGATELKKTPEQGGFVHPCQEKDVAGKGDLQFTQYAE